jgi:RNA polymerase subunit RPABC4/transcription elongation factor Spt4
MLELLGLEDLDQTFGEFIESPAFQAAVYVIVAYIVLIWLASAFWAYRDMRLRTASAITPYVAATAIIIFTPVFFLFGLLIYRIVRPKETIAEVNERALAEEAMLAEVASHSHCANCSRPVHEDWIICPSCRNRLRRVCPNCEHLIELDWTLCAWCGKDFERADAPGTTAFMPSARPVPPPQQQRRLPAPPPPTRQAPPTPPATEPKAAPSTNPAPPTQPQQGAPSTQPKANPAPRSSQAPASGSASTASTGAGTAPPPRSDQAVSGGGATAPGTQPASGAQPTAGA